jgi:hypothetical protein
VVRHPQSAVLSPTLYNLFTSDAFTADEFEIATFPDDTLLYLCPTQNVCDGLESQLNSLMDYFKKWKKKENASKTQAIYFTRCWSPRRLLSTRIVNNCQEVPVSDDKRHKFTFHTAKSIERAKRAFIFGGEI